ncbi:MAG: hypothetical protein WD768_18960 [Phycisphaeraceae bacterium]
MNPSPAHPGHPARSRLFLAAILSAAIVTLLPSCGDGSAPPPPKNVAFDPDIALKELAQLEDDFAQAKQIRRLEPMVEKAKAFIAKYPKYHPAYTLLGKVYIELYKWPEAYDELQKSLKLDANQPMVHHLAGTILYEMRDFPAAEANYLTAHQLSPLDPLHMVYLAQVYIRTERFTEALTRLTEALVMKDDYHQAYATLCDLYMKQNEADLALQHIDKAIKFTALDDREALVPYILKRAAVHRRLGDATAAMTDLENNLLDHEQFQARAAEDIAITWGMLNEPAKAAEFYERAIAANSTEWRLFRGAVAWNIKAGNLAKARTYLRGLQNIDPHQPAIKELQESIAKMEEKLQTTP